MAIANTTKLIIASLTTVGVGGVIGGSYYLIKPEKSKSSETVIENKDQTKTLPEQKPEAEVKASEVSSTPPKVPSPSPLGSDRAVTSSSDSSPSGAGGVAGSSEPAERSTG